MNTGLKLVDTRRNFTPERIRILAKKVLPRYGGRGSLAHEEEDKLWREICDVIANPTERSKKTFRALPPSHKWALISLLEVGAVPDFEKASKSYCRLCPENEQEAFDDVIDQLTDSFVKRHQMSDPFAAHEESTETLVWYQIEL